jgi:riboflavin kinase / FMN adenylyltransferase
MKLLFGNDRIPSGQSTVVTIGNFDGVHRGHRQLLAEVAKRASAGGHKSAVITFEPHTRFVVGSGEEDYLLTSFDEKARLVEMAGIDYLVCIPFDKGMSEKSPEEFIREVLVGRLNVAGWIMGQGHAIGRNRAGSEIFLHEMEGKYHFTIFSADLLAREGVTVSSTEIRNLITRGRVAEAVSMLGHPYLISVERTPGIKLGRKLGFPTLNFSKPPVRKVIPPAGVYAAELGYEGVRECGALYFGGCPTVGTEREIHFEFFSFARGDKEIPEGGRADLWLYSFIRTDKKFAGTDELAKQMAKDVETIKDLFLKEKMQWR